MIENLENHLIGIAIGIRYRANFSIEDQLGKIADTILYSKDAFFNQSVFPRATTSAPAKELVNDKTDDRLYIDNSNMILEIMFGEDARFKREDLPEILNKFNEQIVKGILKDFEIREFRRLGYIRRYLFKIDTLASSFVGKTIGDTLEGVDDINLNFSKRIPVQEALVKKDVLDYDNAIFTVIKKTAFNEIFMAVDYQSFFDPFIPSSGGIKFKAFIEKATRFNSKKYLTWLNENYMDVSNE